jgi:carboxylesterase
MEMKESYPVIQGAEAFFKKGNHIGVLISHGFIGTPQSVRFLGEKIASQGYTVLAPRLKGHGTHYKDMEQSTFKEWIQNLEEGYWFLKQNCSEIFIIGQSMGGTLALNLSSQYSDIKGLVLINAALTSIPSMEEYKYQSEPSYIPEGEPDIKAEDVYEITYDKAPVRSIQELLFLMDETREKLDLVTAPALAFISPEDHVVPIENTEYILSHIQSKDKEIITLHNSYHVASMDNDKELIAEHCCLFIKKNSYHHEKTGIS